MEKTDKPLVSIIMATFNEPETIIKQSIESILNQDYDNIELLIADDSTDEKTIRIIDKFSQKDNRLRIIRKEQRMGFVPALNNAIQAAKGELIVRMDGDDISLSNRISNQVSFAQAHPDIDVFGGNIYIINENGEIISERHYPTTPLKIKLRFIFRSPFAHPTIMFRRVIVEKGFLYDPKYKRAEDIDFFMRLYKKGYKFGNMEEFLLKYRVIGDLHSKRTKDQWIYNHKARRKFLFSKPLFSIASFFVSYAYIKIPGKIVTMYYKRENSKFKK
ncbi:MAG: glycosyltransferase [Prevotella sp.]|nr:glycosyltransferase [Prevotella sp.]